MLQETTRTNQLNVSVTTALLKPVPSPRTSMKKDPRTDPKIEYFNYYILFKNKIKL